MRWPISEQDRTEIVDRLMELVRSDDMPIVIRSVRVLLMLEQQNMQDENTDAGQLRNRLEQILVNLRSEESN